MKQFKQDLLSAIKLSVPMVGAALAQFSLPLTDSLMCGRLGMNALAGVGLGSALLATLLLPLLGMIGAISPMIAQAKGAKNTESIRTTVHQAFILAALVSLPAFFILSWGGSILTWMGQPETLVKEAERYLFTVRWSLLPALWLTILRSFMDGLSRPRPGLIIALSAIGINVLANAVFMFGYLGFPAMGVAGTGWATTCVNLWSTLTLLLITFVIPEFKKHQLLKSPRRFYWPIFKELVQIGGPIACTMAAEVWLFTSLTFFMGYFGENAVAAHQIALNAASFTFMFAMGVSNASTVRVAQAVGENSLNKAKQAGFMGMGLGISCMLVSAACFWFFPKAIVACFIDISIPQNASLVRLASSLLQIAALFQLFDALQVTSQGALRGLKDTFKPMIISLFCYWIMGMGSGLFLAFQMNLREKGLWMGLVIGLMTASILLSRRFFIYFKLNTTLKVTEA